MEKLPFPETNTVQKDKHMSENMTRTKKEQWAKLLAPIRHGMTDPAKVHFDPGRAAPTLPTTTASSFPIHSDTRAQNAGTPLLGQRPRP